MICCQVFLGRTVPGRKEIGRCSELEGHVLAIIHGDPGLDLRENQQGEALADFNSYGDGNPFRKNGSPFVSRLSKLSLTGPGEAGRACLVREKL